MKKIITLNEAKILAKKLKNKKRDLLLAHGVFDVIHIGHINYFREIKKKTFNPILFVTLTADKFVKKGFNRPIFNQLHRSIMLSNLSIVDYVVIINDYTAVPAINSIKPKFYFKGAEYKDTLDDKNLDTEIKEAKKQNSKVRFVDTKKFSSSEIINNKFINFPLSTKKYLRILNNKFNQSKLNNIFTEIKKLKVCVIGESIFDEYVYVKPLNKSPKENLITNLLERKKVFAGGSLAVANNISSFVDDVTILTMSDNNKKNISFLKNILSKKIKKKIIYSKFYKTIKKTRFIEESYSTKKLFSIYEMNNEPIKNSDEKKFYNLIKQNIEKFDLIVLNDFGHELMTPKIVELISKKSKYLSLNVQTNSANIPFNPVTKYQKADFVSIDIPEAKIASGHKYLSKLEMHKNIIKKSKFKNLIFTEGKQGSWYFKNNKSFNTPIFNDKVVDTMGTGDAFFSISSLVMKKTKNIELACFIGNIAGALKVSIEGHSKYLDREEFIKYLKTLIIK